MTPVRTLSVRSIKPCLQVGERWNKVLEAVTELVDKKRHCRITPVISLTEQLQQTIVENWPRRHYSRYREVRALLTYWADPECPSLGVEKAAEKLAEVFGRLYGFDVQIWLIPTIGQPQQFLAVKLTDMVQSYGQDGTLLIFWYVSCKLGHVS